MMQKLPVTLFGMLIAAVAICMSSCKKEHLEVPNQENKAPLIYITAKLDNDSVYFAGGVNGYAGATTMSDNNNERTFNFILQNSTNASQSSFMISINNYSPVLGDPEADLDSSIYAGSRNYGGGLLFFPRAAGISWFDDTGIQYKSTPAIPNSFSIISVDDIVYESETYKKAELVFECYLVHNFTDTIHLTQGEATVLFGVN